MKNVLQRRGPKLNPKKHIFSADHVVFAGHVLLSNWLNPADKKKIAIQNIKIHTNVSELKSFIGLVLACIGYINFYVLNL